MANETEKTSFVPGIHVHVHVLIIIDEAISCRFLSGIS
jgi:hypothetical protein